MTTSLQQYIYCIIFTCVIYTSHADGQFQVYGEAERDQWFADAGGQLNVTTIGFTGFPNNTTLTDQYADVGLTFEGFNLVTLDVPSFEDDWGLRIFDGNDLYFEEPISNISSDNLGNVRMKLYLDDELLFEFQRPLPETFSGVTSDLSFNRVRVFSPSGPITTLDDLHFGPPIPAPGVLAPFGLIFLTHKRRARTS